MSEDIFYSSYESRGSTSCRSNTCTPSTTNNFRKCSSEIQDNQCILTIFLCLCDIWRSAVCPDNKPRGKGRPSFSISTWFFDDTIRYHISNSVLRTIFCSLFVWLSDSTMKIIPYDSDKEKPKCEYCRDENGYHSELKKCLYAYRAQSRFSSFSHRFAYSLPRKNCKPKEWREHDIYPEFDRSHQEDPTKC